MTQDEFETDVLKITIGHLQAMVPPLETLILMLGPLGFRQTRVAMALEDLLTALQASLTSLREIAETVCDQGEN